MRIIRQHLTYTNAAAVLAVFLAAGGAAWAVTSTGATIHACVKRHGGALRIARHCSRRERALNWNQIGPPGAKGAKGATGPRGPTGKTVLQGPTGPVGPSDVYAGGEATGTLAGGYTAYGKVSVPAGSYRIEAKATFIAESKGSQMACALAPSVALSTSWDGGMTSGEAGAASVLSLLGVGSFASTQTIELVCKASSGTGKIENAHLVAVRTESLHGSLPVH